MIWFGVYDKKPAAFVDVRQGGDTLKYKMFVRRRRGEWPYDHDEFQLPEDGSRTFGERITDDNITKALATAATVRTRRRRRIPAHDPVVSQGIEAVYTATRDKRGGTAYASNRTEVSYYIMRNNGNSGRASKTRNCVR